MIHLFHGFLGSPRDLEFLNVFGKITSHDLLTFDFDNFECNENDILIGYSMGGRVALGLTQKLQYKLKKVLILSANPNTLSQNEISERLIFEENITKRMLNDSPSDFFKFWNSLNIFEHDSPIKELSKEKLHEWSKIFTRYRLSNQADYLKDLKNHPDKFSWIVGSKDTKYSNIAKMSGLNYYTIDAGHRIFQHQNELIELIKKENLL